MQALTAYAGSKLMDTALKKVEQKLSKPSAPKQRKRKNPRRGKKGKSVSSVAASKAQLDSKNPLAFRKTRLKRNFALGMSAPVSYDSVVCNFEEMFQPKKISHPEYGAGSVISFSSIVTQVGSNGGANNDKLCPFLRTGLTDPALMAGFLTGDGNWCTGLLINPFLFGSRMFQESSNWALWRPRRLQFKYQTACGTGTSGTLALAFSRDPASFIEASPFQSASNPVPSITALTQTVPNTMANLYRDCILEVTNFPSKPYFINYGQNGQFGSFVRTNDLASVAFMEERACGRIVGLTDTSTVSTLNGYLWCDGEIEFYQPSIATMVIGSTVAPNAPSLHYGPIDQNNLMVNGSSSFTSIIELCTKLPHLRKAYHSHLLNYIEVARLNSKHDLDSRDGMLKLVHDMKLPPLPSLYSLRLGSKTEKDEVKTSVDDKSNWTSIGRKSNSNKGSGTRPSSLSSFVDVDLGDVTVSDRS